MGLIGVQSDRNHLSCNSGISYPNFVNKRILPSLSMPSRQLPCRQVASTLGDISRPLCEAEGDQFSTCASSLITSANDMTKWWAMRRPALRVQEVTAARSVVHGRPSEDSYCSPMATGGSSGHTTVSMCVVSYVSPGVLTETSDGQIISHAGKIPAFSPSRNIGVVIPGCFSSTKREHMPTDLQTTKAQNRHEQSDLWYGQLRPAGRIIVVGVREHCGVRTCRVHEPPVHYLA